MTQVWLAQFLRDNIGDILMADDIETSGLVDLYDEGGHYDPMPDLSHADTCNGDHSDVSGRCGEDPVE